jgi:LysM repeat protein
VEPDDTPLTHGQRTTDTRGTFMNSSDHNAAHGAAYRIGRSMLGTVPIVLVGSMAVSMNMTGPLFAADTVHPQLKKAGVSPAPATEIDLSAASLQQQDVHLASATTDGGTIETASAPTTYRVVAGDTVSSIAGRYGLSTASVLALNGLSWKSTIFPGQTLHLTAARATPTATPAATSHPATSTSYTIVRGDTLSAIAAHHGVSTQALLAANGLGLSSIIYPGQHLTIPGSGASGSGGAVSTPKPMPAAGTASSSGTYTIRTGDTLSSIAKAHHTTVEALLAANHLSWTSTIYAGKKLAIPSSSTATVATASTGTTSPIVSSSLSATQAANARTIISVGRSLGVSDYGIVIALSAAAQESSLTNLAHGDRDSVGLFQQRPSQGWGTPAQLLNTTYAARLFFGGSHNPNAGHSRGLLDIPGWSRMTVTQAAQAVQVSAYPTAYAKWEAPARIWVASL